MKVIRLRDHESNLDPSARRIWGEDRMMASLSVYQVRKGFVACTGYGMAIDGHFPTLDAARTALQAVKA